MNIRILVFSLVLCVSAPLLSMEPIYSLKDALELAQSLGVYKDDLDVITHALLQLACKSNASIVISQDAVFETIAKIMEERVTLNALVQKSEPLVARKSVDSFEEEFERGLVNLAVARATACEYEQQGVYEKSFAAGQHLSQLHTQLEAQCITSSENKWFMAGKSLFYRLRLAAIPTVSTEKGLIIPVVSICTQTPLYQLVSHQQIYSSCGFNALSNACAIQQQVRDGLPITSEQTRMLAELCFLETVHSSDVFKSLLFEDGIHLADGLHIQEAAADIEKKYQMPLHQIYLSASELAAFQDDTTIEPIIDLIKKNPVVHFVINTGGHWVLASVVHEQKGYVLYYLNSTNDPINDGQLGPIISYIEELILRANG